MVSGTRGVHAAGKWRANIFIGKPELSGGSALGAGLDYLGTLSWSTHTNQAPL